MKKLVIADIIVAAICTILYLMFIPHNISTVENSTNDYTTIVKIIPLNLPKIVIEACKVFILVNIPNIFILIKSILTKKSS